MLGAYTATQGPNFSILPTIINVQVLVCQRRGYKSYERSVKVDDSQANADVNVPSQSNTTLEVSDSMKDGLL